MSMALAGLVAFNLICSGNATTGTMDDRWNWINQVTEKFQSTYRIDLDAGRWCAGTCTVTQQIAKVADTQILLANDKTGLEFYLSINREDGTFMYRAKVGDTVEVRMGTCERAPFTGFPALKF